MFHSVELANHLRQQRPAQPFALYKTVLGRAMGADMAWRLSNRNAVVLFGTGAARRSLHFTFHSRIPPDHSDCSWTSILSDVVSTGSNATRLKRSISVPYTETPVTGFHESPA